MKTNKNISIVNLISESKTKKILKTISILMMIIPYIAIVSLCCYMIFMVNPIAAVLILSLIIGSCMFLYLNDKDLWG
jgi:hypothetical protein